MTTHHLAVPINDSQVDNLKIGDTVYLTGKIYTARDMAHFEIKKLLSEAKPLPVDLAGQVIFHAGPVMRKVDGQWEIVVVGPTTSIRMEPYAQMVGELGVKLIIGKGGMAQDSQKTFQQCSQTYLQAAPGCAVQIGSGVKKVVSVRWLENGMPEAMWELEVEKFGPFIVTMDNKGNSRYDAVKEAANRKIIEFYGQ
ncbi:FumA C-terminus/TtdB family hydratase beta subunit [Sporomusa acidovorans]|uniref:L(+)-tartrate dehydratase subunit beta n=1 Tax=Sporomusa acidovorans (strain ATCC 49682 / DSM 3132 / Mol) TaxID=1123286 RepID=A0ABZ3J784_SPOA4|nr:FumA C-terminus/TtdB family hydratase beta subunit [Sporomusa acidovorans]OZC21022.1 L(+)-tartrate dehydratase subunit beta [Sporomusa acidovorans DSM 3132]SDF18074.1 L(+)-tartrate dehydratase beta subunit [Sporomusa acidovorans]